MKHPPPRYGTTPPFFAVIIFAAWVLCFSTLAYGSEGETDGKIVDLYSPTYAADIWCPQWIAESISKGYASSKECAEEEEEEPDFSIPDWDVYIYCTNEAEKACEGYNTCLLDHNVTGFFCHNEASAHYGGFSVNAELDDDQQWRRQVESNANIWALMKRPQFANHPCDVFTEEQLRDALAWASGMVKGPEANLQDEKTYCLPAEPYETLWDLEEMCLDRKDMPPTLSWAYESFCHAGDDEVFEGEVFKQYRIEGGKQLSRERVLDEEGGLQWSAWAEDVYGCPSYMDTACLPQKLIRIHFPLTLSAPLEIATSSDAAWPFSYTIEGEASINAQALEGCLGSNCALTEVVPQYSLTHAAGFDPGRAMIEVKDGSAVTLKGFRLTDIAVPLIRREHGASHLLGNQFKNFSGSGKLVEKKPSVGEGNPTADCAFGTVIGNNYGAGASDLEKLVTLAEGGCKTSGGKIAYTGAEEIEKGVSLLNFFAPNFSASSLKAAEVLVSGKPWVRLCAELADKEALDAYAQEHSFIKPAAGPFCSDGGAITAGSTSSQFVLRLEPGLSEKITPSEENKYSAIFYGDGLNVVGVINFTVGKISNQGWQESVFWKDSQKVLQEIVEKNICCPGDGECLETCVRANLCQSWKEKKTCDQFGGADCVDTFECASLTANDSSRCNITSHTKKTGFALVAQAISCRSLGIKRLLGFGKKLSLPPPALAVRDLDHLSRRQGLPQKTIKFPKAMNRPLLKQAAGNTHQHHAIPQSLLGKPATHALENGNLKGIDRINPRAGKKP